MRIRLPHAASSNLPGKVIALVLLVGILVEIAGIPVVSVARKDRSRPYPCQDRPCGCASADECWHHCCCMNNKEKLAWARAHGVTPPDFVVAAAAQEDDQPAQLCGGTECGESAVGAHEKERACCRSRHNHHDVAADDATRDHGKTDKTEAKVKLVLSDFARQCSGLPQIILLFSDALPCAVSAQWKPAEALVGYVTDAARPCASAELAPPVPPPKLSGSVAA
jgi:hypothetical protein